MGRFITILGLSFVVGPYLKLQNTELKLENTCTSIELNFVNWIEKRQ